MKCLKTTLRKNVLKLAFSGYLEARNLSDAQSDILKRMKKAPGKVIVELTEYEKMDFSFIQLLIILRKDLEQKWKVESEFNLHFSEEDKVLLSKVNIMNLLQIKSEKL